MALQTGEPRTLAEKIWDDHIVVSGGGCAPDLIYIDLHLVHEVTSPPGIGRSCILNQISDKQCLL